MPEYVIKALQKFDYPIPTKPKYALHRWVPKSYGQKVHLDPFKDTLEPLSPSATIHIQRIVGLLLYYARAVDNKTHTALNDIATTQASPIMKTKDATLMLMD